MISGFPYLLAEMNKVPQLLPESLRLLISGGDVLRAKYIGKLKDKVMIYNTYGPSETTVCASCFRADNAEPLCRQVQIPGGRSFQDRIQYGVLCRQTLHNAELSEQIDP